jgi:transcriptional regulator with XRE-family HTH domain
LKLTKRQLSLKLNVSDITIYLWEKNRVKPSLAQIPKIIDFLDRDPFEKNTENLGEKIWEYRRIHGLTQKSLAEQLGVDQTTLAGWERGKSRPIKRNLERILTYIGSFPPIFSR